MGLVVLFHPDWDSLAVELETEIIELDVPYGSNGRFQANVLAKRTLAHFQPKVDIADLATALKSELKNPIEFPELRQACVPGDQVVIAMDRETPRADAIIALLWKELSAGGVLPEDITILQPTGLHVGDSSDPRCLLPQDVQNRMRLKQHDPTDEAACGYLASTAAGERIYLAHEIINADLVIPVGASVFDPLLGYRGEASVLYPAFSDLAAIRKAIGQGHDELSPTDARPLRQQVEEIGWLLGIQFVVSVVPGRSRGVQAIFAGLAEAVSKQARVELQETCVVDVEERADLVLVAVEQDAAGHTWDQVAAAMDAARRIVNREGRIVVLSQLNRPRGPGLEILIEVRTASEALKPIRDLSPPDFLSASRIAKAVDWANVYLLSELPAGDVEDLFIVPLETPAEAAKLLQGDDTMIVIESAQKVFANCR